ncbi:TonB-dependent receptor [Allosphingosinicella flava]|uniref:TonB-dependent receptor n=1 Tax=Allosphingosinicella flava TaxID=2771430 RepID=A0A7T2GIW3_9SPHN|nr:TonB-dependent receptor [Sphingosinicella flava]QPQ54666.1 TonB-dependent receptor [Sphingosinicella flava]
MTKSIWLLSAGALAMSVPAYAQDNSSETSQTTVTEQSAAVQQDQDIDEANDIIVTAQGREQILQDVPLAVNVVDAEALQNSGATDIRALNQLAPSLLVSSTGSESNGSARIRGIGTVGDNPGLESSVAVFIDGVYRSRTGIGLNELGEIDRVEVLRGPQGTLFGRNASAGILNIVSKKPNLNAMEGYGEFTYGNYDLLRLGAGITGPIGESGLGYRLDGVWVQRDGYLKVNDPQGGTESRLNDRDRYFVRGQLSYEPSSDFEVRLIGDYSKRDESCCGAVYLETRETYDPTPGVAGDYAYRPTNRIVNILQALGETFPNSVNGNPYRQNPYNRVASVTPGRTYRNETEDYGLSGQIDWDAGFGTLTSITAYRGYKAGGAGDIDYGRADIAYRPADGNNFRKFETFSQELRLQGSAFEDRLDWLVGAYFANEDLHVADNTRFGEDYGAFAACRVVAGLNNPALVRVGRPGCVSTEQVPGFPINYRQALAGQIAGLAGGGATGLARAGTILSGLDRLGFVSDVGDIRANYYQDSTNYAFFTHNIFNITDQLSVTLGLRYTNENKKFRADFNNNNAACPAQQASLLPLLAQISADPTLTAANRAQLQQVVGGIVTLTCQGNSSTSLNGLDLSDEFDDGELTGTGILSFKPTEDLMTYASYSKGYKAGGYNLDRSALGTRPVGANPTLGIRDNGDVEDLRFAAEKVDAYEIGFKYGGRGFTLNVAGFWQEFKNFQLNTFNGSVFIVQNIGSCADDLGGGDRDASAATGACSGDKKAGVRSRGVEVEASLRPSRDLNVNLGYTYAQTKYRNNLTGAGTDPLDPFLFLLPGDNVSNAPEHVVTTSVSWTPEIGNSGLTGLVYVDSRMTSDYNTGSDLFPEKEQDGYAVVNARIGVRGPDERWAVELWAQNLLDEEYQQVAFNSPFQGANSRAQVAAFGAPGFATANQLFSTYLAEPRTYGLTVRGRF